MARFLFQLLIVALLAIPICSQNRYSIEDSSQKEGILSARLKDENAEKDRKYCLTLGRESLGDNRCFTTFPTETMVWGKGFYEGLAKITVNGKIGFIDTLGREVIGPYLKDAGHFSDGVAPFEDKNGKWGFIDKHGKIVIKPAFDWALSFRDGLAAVQVGNNWGYIDLEGRLRITPKFERAASFSEGMAAVGFYDKSNLTAESPEGKWQNNFIDKVGNVCFPESFDVVSRSFDGGIAIVSRSIARANGSYSESFAINKNGVELWKLNSWYVSWLSDDAIAVAIGKDSDDRNLFGFLGRDGKLLNNKTFSYVREYSEGLAPARKTWVGKEGYINKRGEFVIKPQFTSASPFSEGLAAVEMDELYGYIDKSGKFVVTPQFEFADQFQGGFALVAPSWNERDKMGYIDRSGKYIWKPTK